MHSRTDTYRYTVVVAVVMSVSRVLKTGRGMAFSFYALHADKGYIGWIHLSA